MSESIRLETPNYWPDYELLDSGDFEKLERFGDVILARPEPQAIWSKNLSEDEWSDCHAWFKRDSNHPDKGQWLKSRNFPDPWVVSYESGELSLRFKISLSAFKHVGLFPEQAFNWDFIFEHSKAIKGAKVLNLFAYTGIASLAARAANAEVVHLDSIKQVVSWARENMEYSRLKDIRWIVDDAMKFVLRESRRGNTYQGIILDPPAYGRGPEGEKWVLEEDILRCLRICADLLDPENHFFVINLYSLGFSALIVENLVREVFPDVENLTVGELYLPDQSGRKLPLGTFCRFHKYSNLG